MKRFDRKNQIRAERRTIRAQLRDEILEQRALRAGFEGSMYELVDEFDSLEMDVTRLEGDISTMMGETSSTIDEPEPEPEPDWPDLYEREYWQSVEDFDRQEGRHELLQQFCDKIRAGELPSEGEVDELLRRFEHCQ